MFAYIYSVCICIYTYMYLQEWVKLSKSPVIQEL